MTYFLSRSETFWLVKVRFFIIWAHSLTVTGTFFSFLIEKFNDMAQSEIALRHPLLQLSGSLHALRNYNIRLSIIVRSCFLFIFTSLVFVSDDFSFCIFRVLPGSRRIGIRFPQSRFTSSIFVFIIWPSAIRKMPCWRLDTICVLLLRWIWRQRPQFRELRAPSSAFRPLVAFLRFVCFMHGG